MSKLEDDGGLSSDFIAIETPDDTGRGQSLWVAVRNGWHGDDPDRMPTVQILYQEEHMQSQLAGPVFLSIETWRALNRAVESRIQAHEKRKWWWFKRGPLQRGNLRTACTYR